MNQQIIFNDDITYDDNQQGWIFSGLHSGERINILIKCTKHKIMSDALKFDLEEIVEEWLDNNEPLPENRIDLYYK